MTIKLFRKNLSFSDNKDGQIFLLGGVVITIAILVFGVVITSLSDVTESVNKESFLLDDYNNIRKEFGIILNNNIGEYITGADENINIINFYFNDSRDVFVFIGATHGYYFNSEFIGLTYKGDDPDGLIARLTLSNDYDYICEEVSYTFY